MPSVSADIALQELELGGSSKAAAAAKLSQQVCPGMVLANQLAGHTVNRYPERRHCIPATTLLAQWQQQCTWITSMMKQAEKERSMLYASQGHLFPRADQCCFLSLSAHRDTQIAFCRWRLQKSQIL